MRRFIALGGAALLTLSAAIALPATTQAAGGGSGASQVNGPGASVFLRYQDAEVLEQGRFIEPCMDVLRGLRIASAVTGKLYAQMSFTYTTLNGEVTRDFTVSLSDFYLHPHDSDSNPQAYEMVATQIDVGSDVVLNDQDLDTSVQLVAVVNGHTKALGSPSHITAHISTGGADGRQIPQ